MTNEPIKVIVQDDTGTEQVGGTGGSNTGQTDSLPNQQAQKNKEKSIGQTVGTLIAMRTISYASSNVGKWLGNSRYQNIVDASQKAIGYGVAFAANPYLGLETVAIDGLTTVGNVAYESYFDAVKSVQMQQRLGGKGGYRR